MATTGHICKHKAWQHRCFCNVGGDHTEALHDGYPQPKEEDVT